MTTHDKVVQEKKAEESSPTQTNSVKKRRSKSATRKTPNRSAKSSNKHSNAEDTDHTMFKWDSWGDSLDPDKLDAITREDQWKEDTNEAEKCAKTADESTGKKLKGAGLQADEPLFKLIREHIKQYGKADRRKAYRTLGIALALFAATTLLWMFMWHRACGPDAPDGGQCFEKYGTGWRLAWIVFRGLALVRIFVIFHDCCHLSFLPTPKENRLVGIFVGGIVLTPFEYWRGTHVLHHRVYGNSALHDPARTTRFTRQEYENMPLWKKTLCRFIRDPFVFFIIAPVMVFMIVYRFMRGGMIVNVYKALEWALFYHLTGGGFSWLRDEFCASMVAGAVGFMLFHLQHHVNISYFEPPENHTVEQAAIYGSTYLHIPWYLKWFSLGIEYHHIHHFNMRVPCYSLQECHESAPQYFWKDVPTLPPHKAFRGLFNTMWNPERYRYESFWPYEPVLQATLGE